MNKEETFNLSERGRGRDGRYFTKKDVKEFIRRLKEADIIGRKMLLEVINKLAGKDLVE